jgi:predicted dehydrogenase
MNEPSNTTRRHFLRSALGTAGAVFAGPQIVRSETLGNATKAAANSRIGMGFIGMGLISDGHVVSFPGMKNVQPIAVCDVKDAHLKNAVGTLKGKGYEDIFATPHFEEVLARPDIDAVCVTTPDHWHAAIALAAMKAGKDVYVEKPMTLTIDEGKAMCDASARYGRIVQVGSQQRSNDSFRKAAELVLNGYIGKVHTIVTQLGEFAPPTQLPSEPVPDHLDYDRWLGPAPWEPYNSERVAGNYGGGWRRFWEYGSRKNGDWGAHHFDIIQWALGMDESGPTLFVPKGVDGEHQYHVYADGTKVIRDGDSKGAMIRFIGETGEVHVGRDDAFVTTPAELKSLALKPGDKRLYVSTDHRRDWLQAIRTRSQPICHVGIGHRTGTICQLSGIAELLGRSVKWDPAAQQVVDDPVAARMMDRPRRAPYALPF